MFIILKTDLFSVREFLYNRDLRISTAGRHFELSEFNTFKVRKTTISSTLLIRQRFQVYSCESGIPLFKWKVTLNNLFNKT